MLYIKNISETFQDFPDNENIAVIVFFYGCSHKCFHCQNEDLQNYPEEEGLSVEEAYKKIVEYCKRSNTNLIVFSGGDPYYSINQDNLNDMLNLIDRLENENYKLCVYTGYDISYINIIYKNLFNVYAYWKKPSFLKCGRYEDFNRDKNMGKTENEFILASKNQRFYYRKDNEFLPMSDTHIIKL